MTKAKLLEAVLTRLKALEHAPTRHELSTLRKEAASLDSLLFAAKCNHSKAPRTKRPTAEDKDPRIRRYAPQPAFFMVTTSKFLILKDDQSESIARSGIDIEAQQHRSRNGLTFDFVKYRPLAASVDPRSIAGLPTLIFSVQFAETDALALCELFNLDPAWIGGRKSGERGGEPPRDI